MPRHRDQRQFLIGVTLLVIGLLWLLRVAGLLSLGRLGTLAGAAVLAAAGALCYQASSSGPGRRALLVPGAYLFWGLAVLAAGEACSVMPDAVGALIFFGALALGFHHLGRLDPGRTWARFAAALCVVLGLTSAAGSLRLLGGDLGGAVFLWGTGLILVGHFLGSGRDWALLPGGMLVTLGFAPLLERSRLLEPLTAPVLLLGFALSFGAVFLLGRPGHWEWARYPSIGLLLAALLTFLAIVARPLFLYGLPVVLIALGVYLLLQARTSAPGPPAAQTPA